MFSLSIRKPQSAKTSLVVVALVVATALVSRTPSDDAFPAYRANDGALTFWGYDPLVLLNEDIVRRELTVSDAQAHRLDSLVDRYLGALRPIVLQAKEATARPAEQRDVVLSQLA